MSNTHETDSPSRPLETGARLSSYAFANYGHDAKLYNGIYDLEKINNELLDALKAAPCDCRCSVHNDTMIPTQWDAPHHAILKTKHCERILCKRCAAIQKAEGK